MRSHLVSVAMELMTLRLSLNGAGAAQGDVEVAHGRDEHGQQGEAVNANGDQEGGRRVAVDQAYDAVKGPERCQNGDDRQGPRRVP